MLKPPAIFCCYILISILLNGCSSESDKPTTDPLKGQESKFLNSDHTQSTSEPVFYSLKKNTNNNSEIEHAASEELAINSTSDTSEEQLPEQGTLSPEVLEAIKRNGEIRRQKEEALKTLEEAKKLEAEILKANRSEDDGYVYNNY